MLRRCHSGGSHGASFTHNWDIVNRSELCCQQAMLTFLFLDKCQFIILCFYCLYSISVFLSELFVLVRLNSNICWLNVLVMGSLRFWLVFHFICFLCIGIEHCSFSDVHGLVVGFHGVLVTKGWVHFLFDNCTHGVRQFVGHRIQKSELRIDLLLRERAHSNKLLEEPLIRLTELPELDGHVAFVDDVNNKLAETPVKIDTILLTKAWFAYNFLLHVCQASIDPDFLSIEVKGTETGYQFFIHLVPFEPGVL